MVTEHVTFPVVKANVYLTTMENFAAMNRVYDTFFENPKPV